MQEGVQEGKEQEENKVENKNSKELTEEQKKNLVDIEAFNKMTLEEQKKILEKRVATKKIRCKNWPACKDPTCVFSHPTETVSIFILINIVSIFSDLSIWG